MQSSLQERLHVAIIMDGNGRWAVRRGLPRSAGHKAGVDAVRRITETASDLGVGTLTVYAFSADNWRRPRPEVNALMGLLRFYLDTEVARLVKNGVRLSVIGRRDRLPGDLAHRITRAEQACAAGTRLHLRIALDYSAREAILAAARAVGRERDVTPETFASHLVGASDTGDVDLLIRTSGEQRLSDFLLWECAYAELYFTPVLWPDFAPEHLAEALSVFQGRERRFGGLPQGAPLLGSDAMHGSAGTKETGNTRHPLTPTESLQRRA